jgi:hypothetical protein
VLIKEGFNRRVAALFNNLTPGKFSTFSFSIFGNPLPFYHLCGIAGIVEGFGGSIKAIINSTRVDSITLFSFTVGIAVYLSVMIANKKFLHEIK